VGFIRNHSKYMGSGLWKTINTQP